MPPWREPRGVPYTDSESDLDLGDLITGLSRHIENLGAMIAESTMRPRHVRLSASAVADAAGNALLIFDACPQGSEWALFQLAIGGITWTTAAAGAAVAF